MWLRFFIAAILVTLTAQAEIKVLDDKSFNTEIQTGNVLVEFYGPWCGPCKQMAPVLDQMEQEMQGQVKFVKVNIDDSSELSNRYNVQAVPTIVLFVDGKEKSRLVGFQDKASLRKLLSSYTKAPEIKN